MKILLVVPSYNEEQNVLNNYESNYVWIHYIIGIIIGIIFMFILYKLYQFMSINMRNFWI